MYAGGGSGFIPRVIPSVTTDEWASIPPFLRKQVTIEKLHEAITALNGYLQAQGQGLGPISMAGATVEPLPRSLPVERQYPDLHTPYSLVNMPIDIFSR